MHATPAGSTSTGPGLGAPADTLEQRLIGCTVCHGKADVVVRDAYYPRLLGKPAGYLFNQLINFREGRRSYPLMTYLVGNLPEPYLREIAEYFAGQHPPYPNPQAPEVDAAALERGRKLVFEGDRTRGLPACAACHGQALTGVAPDIPGLLGLPRDYINAQFGAWRNGARHTVKPDCMGDIANTLSIDEISSASAWLASRPVPGEGLPAPRLEGSLPKACGSVAASSAGSRP